MRSVLLDPFLLSVPEEPEGRAKDWADAVLQWDVEIRRSSLRHYFSAKCMHSIYQCGRQPSVDACTGALLRGGVNTVTGWDISRVMGGWLHAQPFVEDELPEIDICVDHGDQCAIAPAVIAERLPMPVRAALAESLLLIHLRNGRCHPSLQYPFGSAVIDSDALVVEGTALVGDADNELQAVTVEARYLLAGSPERWIECFSLSDLLQKPIQSERLSLAMLWKNREINRSIGGDIVDLPYPKLLASFVDDFSNIVVPANRAPATIEKTVFLLRQSDPPYHPSLEIHELESPDGHQILRSSDGAKAWRAYLSQGPGALRLHYWKKADGEVELANVQDHDTCTITE